MNETLTLNEEKILKMIEFYKDYKISNNNQYVRFAAKNENCTILIYLSNKVVFQGNKASYEASIWKEETTSSITLPQSGSDEVGTGDYFGPVCVCASYVDEHIYDILKKYNITDSKALTDDYIRKIGNDIVDIVPHSLLILSNEKYNTVHQTNNLNAIKAKLHNSCYLYLSEKVTMPSFNVVDQFAEEGLYYHYLAKEPKVFRNLHFETKAEAKYIAVATSSIIARYAFLKAMDALNEKYNLDFPKGAGKNVDSFLPKFINEYGFEELQKVAKLHFQNTNKVQH
ncbi:MAG: ribonuclease HIII [Erysipelotrichales bacterium]|nr:ribonuclease HIII [Erysipelotrichales bacterium]